MVDRLDSRSHGAVKHWPIVLLRIYTGLFFAWNGFGKISRGSFADGMEGFLNGQLQNSFDFYRPFIETVVLPNKTLFAALVAWGELAVGLALVVGLATRYASAIRRNSCLEFLVCQRNAGSRRHEPRFCLVRYFRRARHGARRQRLPDSMTVYPTNFHFSDRNRVQ